jgi:GAF domain-containing protein
MEGVAHESAIATLAATGHILPLGAGREAQGSDGRTTTMVTIGEQLQLSRRLGTALASHRASLLGSWLRVIRDIPRDFGDHIPETHLEEFAPLTLDALIAYLTRGDRKAARRVATSWARQQDGLGCGLGDSIRIILALGPAIAPALRRLGLDRGQTLIESFTAQLAEDLSRAYTQSLKRTMAERSRANLAAEERLLSLQTVAGAIAQERDPERTLDLIARQVVKLTGGDAATVYLPDEDTGELRATVNVEPNGEPGELDTVPIEGSPAGHVYRSGHLLVAGEPDEGTSTILAPLRTRDGVIGVLGVRKLSGAPFDRTEIELLGLFADQAAIALDNAQLFRKVARRTDELSTLYRIGAVANRSLDLDRILTDALDHTLEALGLRMGSIYLLDRDGCQLEPRVYRGFVEDAPLPAPIPLGVGPIGQVAATGDPARIDDAGAYPQLVAGLPPDLLTDPGGYLGVPLRAKERTLGVLNLLGKRSGDSAQRARDLTLLRSIGDQIGVAIDNAHLLAGREERLARLTALNDILRAISAVLDLDSLYDAIYLGCSRLFETTNFYIALVDPLTGDLLPKLWYSEGRRATEREGAPIVHGLSPVVVAEGHAIVTADYMTECRLRGATPSPRFTAGALSWLGAPLIVGGRTLGTVVVASNATRFTTEDATLLSAVASGCAVAIENARAYASEQRRVAQLRALNEISRQIVSIREVEQLLPLITDTVRDRFDYNHVGILLYDSEQGNLVLRAQANHDNALSDLGLRIAVGDHLAGAAAATRRPVLANDVTREPRYMSTTATAATHAELAMPIVLGEQLLGVLDVQSSRAGTFDTGDVATLQTLADGVAVAIENARLFEAERRRRQELTSILDVTTAATSSLVLDDVLKRVARGISQAVDGLGCILYLLDDDGARLLPASGVGHAGTPLVNGAAKLVVELAHEGFLREVVESKRAQVTSEAATDPRTDKAFVRTLGLKSTLAVPLIAKSRTLGVAVVTAGYDRYEFSPAQVRLVEGIADTTALALENARLFAHSHELATTEERNRLAREIHDTLAQGLTAVTLHLEVADALFDDPALLDDAREKVRQALELTRANLDEARRSVLDLRAAPLQDLTLPQALAQLLQRASEEHSFEGSYRNRGIEGRLPARLEAGFYRIAQELLSNIGKHAHATQVDMTTELSNGSLILAVADDGVGFDLATTRVPGVTGGFGLVGLRERVALLGGTLQLDSAPDEGTCVRVAVPYYGGK